MIFWDNPLTHDNGYILVFLHTTVPGFNTLLHPTSTLSPSIAPNFFKPVSICSLSYFTTTNFYLI